MGAPKGGAPKLVARRLRSEALELSYLERADAGYQPRPQWQDRAPCLGAPLTWWFGNDGRGPRICARCPVRCDCTVANLLAELRLPAADYAVGYIGVSAKARQAWLRRQLEEAAA